MRELGYNGYLTVGTVRFDASQKTYESLGFSEHASAEQPVQWIDFRDGSLRLILAESRENYLSLTYLTEDMDMSIKLMKQAGLEPVVTMRESDEIKQVVAQLDNGMFISAHSKHRENEKDTPKLKTLIDIDYFKKTTSDFPNEKCGIFGELSLPVKELEHAILFWNNLGFELKGRYEEPYPWAILSDGHFIIGLHFSTEFSQPAITYFAKDMEDKLKVLEREIPGISRIHERGTAELVTPEGQKFFLFTLSADC